MGPLYRASDIANYFLDRAQQGDAITQMKVQKLVYFAHWWHLGITKNPLIRYQVEAWSYGPSFLPCLTTSRIGEPTLSRSLSRPLSSYAAAH